MQMVCFQLKRLCPVVPRTRPRKNKSKTAAMNTGIPGGRRWAAQGIMKVTGGFGRGCPKTYMQHHRHEACWSKDWCLNLLVMLSLSVLLVTGLCHTLLVSLSVSPFLYSLLSNPLLRFAPPLPMCLSVLLFPLSPCLVFLSWSAADLLSLLPLCLSLSLSLSACAVPPFPRHAF